MVVKSEQEVRHVEDLQGVFEVLRQHKLRLNAEKCAFGMGVGNRGQPRPDQSRESPQAAKQSKRGASIDRDVSCTQPVHLQIL